MTALTSWKSSGALKSSFLFSWLWTQLLVLSKLQYVGPQLSLNFFMNHLNQPIFKDFWNYKLKIFRYSCPLWLNKNNCKEEYPLISKWSFIFTSVQVVYLIQNLVSISTWQDHCRHHNVLSPHKSEMINQQALKHCFHSLDHPGLNNESKMSSCYFTKVRR